MPSPRARVADERLPDERRRTTTTKRTERTFGARGLPSLLFVVIITPVL
jgi:hypothetical protein